MSVDFSMAYDDNRNALQLHIKVNNGNNILMSPKYKVGSLRIPDDPSWPKIPQRNLTIKNTKNITVNTSNTSIVNTKETGTVMETPSQQSATSFAPNEIGPQYSYQRNSCTYLLKRKPSYTDPRFKKVRSPECETIPSVVSISVKQSDVGGISKPALEKNDVTKQVEEGEKSNSIVDEDKKNVEIKKSKSEETRLNQKILSQSAPLINFTPSHRSSSSQTNKIFIFNKKPKMKVEANLICTDNQNRCKKHSRKTEPQTTNRRNSAAVRLLKKIKSYLETNSRLAMIDSTSMCSDSSKHKPNRSYQNVRKLNNRASLRRNSYIKSSKSERRTYNKYQSMGLQKALHDNSCTSECYECDLFPKTNMGTGSTTSYSRSIPLETQELLSKSYWRYYNKLREKIEDAGNVNPECLCHLLMGQPETKRQKTETFCDAAMDRVLKIDSEMQTLRQCSALSSMINTALDPTLRTLDAPQIKEMYINKQFKSTICSSSEARKIGSDNCDGQHSAIKPSVFNNKSANNKPVIEMNSLIFVGSMIYLFIMLLLLLSDYFFHKLNNDYETTSYADLLVEYVSLSFKEAFDDITNNFKGIISNFQSRKKYKPTYL